MALYKLFLFRCHSYDYNDTGDNVCRLSHHSAGTLTQVSFMEKIILKNHKIKNVAYVNKIFCANWIPFKDFFVYRLYYLQIY